MNLLVVITQRILLQNLMKKVRKKHWIIFIFLLYPVNIKILLQLQYLHSEKLNSLICRYLQVLVLSLTVKIMN